jgi:hypothetical protein
MNVTSFASFEIVVTEPPYRTAHDLSAGARPQGSSEPTSDDEVMSPHRERRLDQPNCCDGRMGYARGVHRLAALVIVGVGCGSSPAPRPSQPTPSAPAPQPAPPPPVAAQQFANGDMGYRYDDAERKDKLVAAAQKIDTAVADEMTRQRLPGLALGIVVDGELVYSKGYGLATCGHGTAHFYFEEKKSKVT